MRILVIEDNRRLAAAIATGLGDAGYRVDRAEDGATGLAAGLEDRHDAIVLDLMLPEIDGLSVLRRLRNHGIPTPVLILSARDAVADRIGGLDQGVFIRLEAGFARERRFSADVAHELRTPLAVLRTEIEVALRRPTDRAADREVLGGALQTIEEMSALVDALLQIARAETTAATARDRVDLGELVDRCWTRERDRTPTADRKLRLDIAPDTELVTDRELLRAIMQNLLANAAAHGGDGEVVVASAPTEGLVVSVCNTAPDLDPDAVSHLFERFWRADPGRTGTAHSGLGLSLVDAAARSLGMTVSAALDNGRLTVRVTTVDKE